MALAKEKIMEFKEKVKIVREKLGLTQEQLASMLGLSFCTINRWENGRAKPSIGHNRNFNLFCRKRDLIFDDDIYSTANVLMPSRKYTLKI